MLIPTVRMEEGRVVIIDQRLLPHRYERRGLSSVSELTEAIIGLAVRGAPALGVAAAFGILLAVEERWRRQGPFFDMEGERLDSFPAHVGVEEVRDVVERAASVIAATRPTAVNLFWALARMKKSCRAGFSSSRSLLCALYREAMNIYREDVEMCRAMGRNGAELLGDGDGVITHCNTGGLATSGLGTALGVVFAAAEQGKRIKVYADETRPLLQGARLTTWECRERGVEVVLICEGMAGYVMAEGLVASVLVGADRIAANGDVANKIGTLNLAVLARHFGIPFYVVAPSSTIDRALPDGSRIPIEKRDPREVTEIAGTPLAPEGIGVMNPAFDLTPASLLSAIVTEKGIARPPFAELARWAR